LAVDCMRFGWCGAISSVSADSVYGSDNPGG